MRLIDADTLKEWFSNNFAEDDKIDNREIHEVIDIAPTVEAKKGQWNPIDVYTAQCSNCGKTHRTSGADLTRKAYVHKALYKFCPNCGARMQTSDNDKTSDI